MSCNDKGVLDFVDIVWCKIMALLHVNYYSTTLCTDMGEIMELRHNSYFLKHSNRKVTLLYRQITTLPENNCMNLFILTDNNFHSATWW